MHLQKCLTFGGAYHYFSGHFTVIFKFYTTVTLPSGNTKSAGNRQPPKNSVRNPLAEIADRLSLLEIAYTFHFSQTISLIFFNIII